MWHAFNDSLVPRLLAGYQYLVFETPLLPFLWPLGFVTFVHENRENERSCSWKHTSGKRRSNLPSAAPAPCTMAPPRLAAALLLAAPAALAAPTGPRQLQAA